MSLSNPPPNDISAGNPDDHLSHATIVKLISILCICTSFLLLALCLFTWWYCSPTSFTRAFKSLSCSTRKTQKKAAAEAEIGSGSDIILVTSKTLDVEKGFLLPSIAKQAPARKASLSPRGPLPPPLPLRVRDLRISRPFDFQHVSSLTDPAGVRPTHHLPVQSPAPSSLTESSHGLATPPMRASGLKQPRGSPISSTSLGNTRSSSTSNSSLSSYRTKSRNSRKASPLRTSSTLSTDTDGPATPSLAVVARAKIVEIRKAGNRERRVRASV